MKIDQRRLPGQRVVLISSFIIYPSSLSTAASCFTASPLAVLLSFRGVRARPLQTPKQVSWRRLAPEP